MRKNYMYLVLLLVFNTGIFAQKVILTPTAVNGASVSSSGPINLGGTPSSTVSLGVRVEMPSIPGNTGTISIYSLNGLNSNVVTGGNGGSLIFNEGNVASRSFVINLNWSAFPTSGGFIFAEYKTASGVAYKSGYISVVKNATMGGGTINPPADALNPSKIPNSLCCNQIVRLGDKPVPIVGSQYVDPYENFIYGINNRWQANNGRILNLDNANKTLHLDYTSELKNITVTRELGYKSNNEYPNKSNTITINVVPSPILTNEISVVAPVDSNGFFEITDTNPKQIAGTEQSAQVNLTILQDPFHTSQRGDTFTQIERFEWEYTKTNTALGGPAIWTTINGENDYFIKSFNPSDISTTEDNYYLLRRIAIYQNIKRVSNTLKIVLRTIRKNNIICCDQTLTISAVNTIDSPNLIIGSDAIPELNGYLKYQWQSQSVDNNTSKLGNWTNINGATLKDFLPPSLQLTSVYNGRTGETKWTSLTSYNYRRITVPQYYDGEYSYSNEINLSSVNYNYITTNPITVYPNPASSIINIQNNGTTFILNNAPITIVNMIGASVINPNNFSVINSNLMSVDISNLPVGTYFIVIDLSGKRSTRTAFFKNN